MYNRPYYIALISDIQFDWFYLLVKDHQKKVKLEPYIFNFNGGLVTLPF